MTAGKSSPAEVFMGLREQVFRIDRSAIAPSERIVTTKDGQDVYGVAMEGGLAGGSYLVLGLCDGTASLYLSSGGGSLGGQGIPRINAAAKRFVEIAAAFCDNLPLVSEYPIPSAEKVRFSILTGGGVRAGEATEDELSTEKNVLSPLFAAGQEIITGFRMVEEREPANEAAYFNCLLTTLARGTKTSVTLDADDALPDPAGLTNDNLDLEWIAELGFDLGKLSQTEVIEMVEQLAGFRSFQFWKRERTFSVRLASHGGKSLSDVTFVVRRRRNDGGHQVEISVQR